MISSKKTELLVGLFVIIMTAILSYAYSYCDNNRATLATVVIDAGHGGYDPGKVGINDALEKNINLLIAKKLEKYLSEKNFLVVMTRNDDNSLTSEDNSYKKTSDLKKRCEIIKDSQADFCISIHQNSYTDSRVKGAQVFYFSASDKGEALAKSIQKKLIEHVDNDNTRQAKANDDYYMLLNSSCPAVIVECGFLSNKDEADLLCTDEYQNKIAKAIGKGFIEYFKRSADD